MVYNIQETDANTWRPYKSQRKVTRSEHHQLVFDSTLSPTALLLSN